jgi:uncharacterized protein YraI
MKMNSKRKYIVTMAAAVGMAIAAASPAMAQGTSTPVPTVQPTPVPPPLTASTSLFGTANFLVNVRSGPARTFPIIGKVRIGDALDITGKLANGSWLRVNFNGQEGWVSAPLFEVTGDVATIPEAVAPVNASAPASEATAEPAVFQPGTLIGDTRGNVNLRSTASTKGEILVVIPFSTELVATGRTETKNWVRVTFDGKTGWITSGAFSVSQGDIDTVPVVDDNGNPVQATAVPTATS